MTNLSESNIPPWYKQFWPWFLMFLPASAVVAGITTVIIATNNRDHMVVDNYYKKGLAINRVITQQQQAARLGLFANSKYDPVSGKLDIVLDAGAAMDLTSLSLSLVHSTRADFDRTIILHKTTQGVFTTRMKNINAGGWKLILEPADKQWRLDAKVVFPINKWVFKPEV